MYSEVIKEIKKMNSSKKKSTFKIEDAELLRKIIDKDMGDKEIEVKLIYCSEAN